VDILDEKMILIEEEKKMNNFVFVVDVVVVDLMKVMENENENQT